MDRSTGALLALAAAFTPDVREGHELAGHQCPECRQNLGHAGDCFADAGARFAMHCRDHPPCRAIINTVIATGNGSGLCKRGLRLFEKAKAICDAKDAEYARKMGGLPAKYQNEPCLLMALREGIAGDVWAIITITTNGELKMVKLEDVKIDPTRLRSIP